jgi:hypothetical protein
MILLNELVLKWHYVAVSSNIGLFLFSIYSDSFASQKYPQTRQKSGHKNIIYPHRRLRLHMGSLFRQQVNIKNANRGKNSDNNYRYKLKKDDITNCPR